MRFPLPELVFYERVPKRMRDLREVPWHLIKAAFGENVLSDSHAKSSEEDLALQRAGVTAVERLRAGVYDDGFVTERHGKLSDVMKGYEGVLPVRSPTPQLVNSDELRLEQYVAPTYPAIAKAARVQGKVKLELEVDLSNGKVLSVVPLEGHRMLEQASIDAAKQWRFSTLAAPKQPVTAILEFSLACSNPVP